MAETPWGQLPVQDSHVHFFSHRFFEALAQQKKLSGTAELPALLGWVIPPPDSPALLAQAWVDELNKHGVEKAALIASMHGDEDSVAEAVAHDPYRFYGYFMLDPTQADALERMTAAVRNKHLHAVCLFPAMHTYSIADKRVVPILEMASDNRMAVFVHCGALSVGVRKKLGLPSQFNLSFSNPLDLHPVALHFPRIHFVVPHFGAGLLRETLMLADLCPNVFIDTSSSNRWMRYEGLDLRTVFQRTLDVTGPDRLLFGSDSSFFPRGWHGAIFEQQTKTLYELGIDVQQVSKILRFNLENVHSERVSVGIT
jgi:predicted TIM-barrel fold metal-dependent hydrolase